MVFHFVGWDASHEKVVQDLCPGFFHLEHLFDEVVVVFFETKVFPGKTKSARESKNLLFKHEHFALSAASFRFENSQFLLRGLHAVRLLGELLLNLLATRCHHVQATLEVALIFTEPGLFLS